MNSDALKPALPRILITSGVVIAVLLLLMPLAMLRGLDHDEHQFVASGALLANHSALPYRDYPYFHMPNLVFIYGLLFHVTDHLLLAARMLSVICAALALGAICWTAMRLSLDLSPSRRLLIALGAVLLLLCNPLFKYTSGRAWNHDVSTLLALVAFLAYCRSTRQGSPAIWMAGSGICFGLAIGTRLTYLPLLVPLAGATIWHPEATSWPKCLRLAGAFGGGVLIALVPALFLLVLAPDQFLFGNFEWPRLNTQHRQEAGHVVAMTLAGKLKYAREALREPGNLVVALALVALTPWATLVRRDSPALEDGHRFEMLLLLTLIPFLLAGSFAPTPTWYQYLYAPVPFLVLGVLYGLAVQRDEAALKTARRVFAVVVAVAVAYGSSDYRAATRLVPLEQWFPAKAHRMGREIAVAIGEGKVLTLAPIFPLEGRRGIYEPLATGPFAWRTARLIPDSRRRKLGVISEEDLPDLLRRDPPGAVLVGFERDGLEGPLLTYAQRNGYTPRTLTDGTIIWLAPR